MKSIIGTIIIFIGLYILVITGTFEFLSQDFIFPMTLAIIAGLFVVAIVVLGVPSITKKGEKHEDTNPDK